MLGPYTEIHMIFYVLHSPHKGYKHQRQHTNEIHGRHKIRRPLSREPHILGY